MRGFRRFYLLTLSAVGIALLSISAVWTGATRIDIGTILLLGLAIPTGWLRFKLEPSGYLTLSPVVFYVALLLREWSVALLVATLSALVSAKFFGGRPWSVAAEEAGEEGITASAAIATLAWAGVTPLHVPEPGALLAFTAAVAAYVAMRLALGVVRSRLVDGVGPWYYMVGAGRSLLANLVLFAVVALGISYLTGIYGDFGYFILAFATIALIEFYQPWKLLSEQTDVLFTSLAMIAQAIDIKDPYTARHSRNVAELAVMMGRVMRLPETEVRKIRIGALLHDIGKIGVSGRIIRKPANLEADEATAMRKHPDIGADIMQPIELLAQASDIVRHHHEHYDGTGYPDGLVGGRIPMGSRIILVADAFNAMTTDRPYRRGRSTGEAVRILKDHSGRQFDPTVVRALERILDLA